MRTNKRAAAPKIVLAGAIVLVLLALLLICVWPRPLVPSPYTVAGSTSSKSDICVTRVAFDGADLSGEIDDAALVEVLSGYSCRLSPFASTPSELSLQNAWEINLIRGGKPFQIVIGDSARCGSDGKMPYTISNAGSLRQELDSLRQ